MTGGQVIGAATVERWLPAYLPSQRWYAGTSEPSSIVVEELDVHRGGDLVWTLVTVDGVTYQLFLGTDTDGGPFDALADPELCLAVLDLVTEGRETAERVRPMGVEQSNTSLVFDERLVVKVYRRVAEGPNPDVELTTALATHGFAQVAAPVAVWRLGGRDLAIAQPFLPGAEEGWALALASRRDRGSAADDFAGAADQLGRLTAEMHLALARAFGARRPDGSPEWLACVATQAEAAGVAETAAPLLARVAGLTDTGPLQRVHGDFHLGQVLRTDAGWFVLDFEGEPARPMDERRRPASPLKDVSGMLRSFHYASAVAAAPGDGGDGLTVEEAEAWETRTRQAFLDGYLATPGIEALLPGDPVALHLVLDALELEKAVYELGYERAHRPDWTHIPLTAIDRLVGSGRSG